MFTNSFLTRVAPWLFVLLWSSAFIGARFGLPYSEPLTFLFIRFVMVTVIFLLLSLLYKATWPTRWQEVIHLAVVGALIHTFYLSCVFVALDQGVSIGFIALILGLQPALTVIIVNVFPENFIAWPQWLGISLGFAGVFLVTQNNFSLYDLDASKIFLVGFGVFCITIGTIYQRRYCSNTNLLTGNFIQSITGASITGCGAFFFEELLIQWTPEFIGALIWMVLVVSVGAHSLFLFMLRQNQVARVTSLFYLTPPTASLMAFLFFGETLNLLGAVGTFLVIIGVFMISRHENQNPKAL